MADPVLILGATSAIARATANELAAKGHPVILAGRDEEELLRIAADIRIRYDVHTRSMTLDINNVDRYEAFCSDILEPGERLGGVICAVGYLGEQETAFSSHSETQNIIQNNLTGPATLLNCVSKLMMPHGRGFIIGIASVAGDRGRQSNFIYGAAKGGFALYLQGLRNRLFTDGIHVLTVKPGFVDTAMTWGMDGLFLVASPESIGRGIIRALEKRRNTVYLPEFWRGIMLIIRSIPETLFKRLSL